MPTEKLVPYTLEIYEYRNSDEKANLSQLHDYDSGFDENHALDHIYSFLEGNKEENLEGPSSEKTLIVEEIEKSDNVVEAIISSGYHGYEADIKDADTGELTHVKGTNEAEQMPLYALFFLPRTIRGEPFNQGENIFIILQQVNRLGIKTRLKKHLKHHFLESISTESTFKINPISTEEVLEKVLNSERIFEVDLQIQNIPSRDDDARYQLVEGMRRADIRSQSLVLKPEYGGTFGWVQQLVQRAKDEDVHFAEFVSDEVENFTVSIVNDDGRAESFSLFNEEIAMRKDLPDHLETERGLITADALRRETNSLMNEILDADVVEPLQGSALVSR